MSATNEDRYLKISDARIDLLRLLRQLLQLEADIDLAKETVCLLLQSGQTKEELMAEPPDFPEYEHGTDDRTDITEIVWRRGDSN